MGELFSPRAGHAFLPTSVPWNLVPGQRSQHSGRVVLTHLPRVPLLFSTGTQSEGPPPRQPPTRPEWHLWSGQPRPAAGGDARLQVAGPSWQARRGLWWPAWGDSVLEALRLGESRGVGWESPSSWGERVHGPGSRGEGYISPTEPSGAGHAEPSASVCRLPAATLDVTCSADTWGRAGRAAHGGAPQPSSHSLGGQQVVTGHHDRLSLESQCRHNMSPPQPSLAEHPGPAGWPSRLSARICSGGGQGGGGASSPGCLAVTDII